LIDIQEESPTEKMVAAGVMGYDITPDGKTLLLLRGAASAIQAASPGAPPEPLITSGMIATIDQKAEWRQMFSDTWRYYRDYFYDPHLHNVDWEGIRKQYAPMIEDCVRREEVSYVISEMISEMNVGHAYYSGGDNEPGTPGLPVGLLGADFVMENGAYKIAKIHRGAPWDLDAMGPLSQPGSKIKLGHYVLAVNGVPVDTKNDIWSAFNGLGGRLVSVTVSEKPIMDASAVEVPVRLLTSDTNLRYREWIETNRQYVDKASGGRVGYIYVPDTGQGGQDDLYRQFQSNLNKEALIIDERWNGGGQIPDRFIELLNRPITNYWARRDGNDWHWPVYSHQGPKCMLINGMAGSGGDAFPYYFRQAGLGKLIGTRTWGGLVGISGNYNLIDGAGVTVPNFAFYKKDGNWGIEGHGVDPDIEVLDDPAQMQNGGDPQLDVAVKQMLDELKTKKYVAPKRPAYPDRKGMGIKDKDK
jgi:tricorn protease